MRKSPQLENGYTAIANEIMEALARTRIPGSARQILDVILRKTYGWSKKKDQIPLVQFVEATGIKKPEVCRAIRKLEAMKIISIGKNANELASSYSFNKHYKTWIPLAKMPTLAKTPTIIGKNANKPLAKMPPSKAITKAITKTKYTNGYRFEEFWELYPLKKGKAAAKKKWDIRKPTEDLATTIIEALKKQLKYSHLDLREKKRFCPHPTTWLNQQRWEDEVDEKTGNGKMINHEPGCYAGRESDIDCNDPKWLKEERKEKP